MKILSSLFSSFLAFGSSHEALQRSNSMDVALRYQSPSPIIKNIAPCHPFGGSHNLRPQLMKPAIIEEEHEYVNSDESESEWSDTELFEIE
jgi:hypothetical protein